MCVTCVIASLSCVASQLAFDQYGQLSEQFETESALRERAESVATQVRQFHNTTTSLGTGFITQQLHVYNICVCVCACVCMLKGVHGGKS